MKPLIAFAVVVLLLVSLNTLVDYASSQMVVGPLKIITINEAAPFDGAVEFPQQVSGDQAIVTVFYWDRFPGVQTEIVRSRVSVIPVIPGVRVGFDPVPVARDKVMKIDVELVKGLGKQTYEKF